MNQVNPTGPIAGSKKLRLLDWEPPFNRQLEAAPQLIVVIQETPAAVFRPAAGAR